MQYIHRLMIAIMPVVRVVKNLVVLHAVGIATKVASELAKVVAVGIVDVPVLVHVRAPVCTVQIIMVIA